jgi:MSHA biogenesis protein MshL
VTGKNIVNKSRFLCQRCLLWACVIGLAACATPPHQSEVLGKINSELQQAATQRKQVDAVSDQSLMPPLAPPIAVAPPLEPRFDLSVVDAPATQVFMALVSGTRYSMLLPPDIGGSITINLKDVTVREALDTIRELYGYEFRIQEKRIFIEPNTIKTRIFHVNYLASRRVGSSELRVSGNSVANSGTTGTSTPGSGLAIPAGTGTSTATQGVDTSRVSMATNSDFWGDLRTALTAIVGTADGRSVVINDSSGVVVVRALPNELRNVEKYLKTTQLVVDRQVMLEAKIIEVKLSDGSQTGVNWSLFRQVSSGGHKGTLGAFGAAPGTTLRNTGAIETASDGLVANSVVAASTLSPGF